MRRYFVTGIDTDSGKTLVSTILCQALQGTYWKPIQAGRPTDSDTLRSHIGAARVHPERYILNMPASPHAAAAAEGITITLGDFTVPDTAGPLIIEGAGGCLVPINDKDFVIDLMRTFGAEIILVADLYLGSINHTLLTIEALQARRLPVAGIIFNGEPNAASEQIILHHSKLPCLLRLPKMDKIGNADINRFAEELRKNL